MTFRVSVQLSEQRSIITSLSMSLRGRNLSPGTLCSEGMHHSSNRAVRSVHWESQQQRKQHEPTVVTAWWSKPTNIFLVVSVTCLAFMILSYNMHPPGRQTVAILASTPQSIISSVKQQQQQPWLPPCSSVPRPAAVCSHRGNASELIQSPADGGGYLRGIELLWHKGVRCFDVDLVQTRDGEVVVGHPAVLASKIRPGRGKNIFSQLFGWGFAPNMSQLSPADQLLQWRLPQLRGMGLTSDMAPTVQEAFHVLARLVSESNTSGNGTSSPLLTGRAALRGRRGGLAGAPLLMMELKGVAAHSKESFARVAESAAAAGVADSVVLWHILDKGTTSETDRSRQQQQDAVKQSLAQAAALVRDVRTARPQAANVLMGLGIVDDTDLVLRPEAHHPVAATELLGGVMPEDLDVFDVVGPSIQLPVEALASLSAAKPVIGWVIDDKARASRGLWMGLDGLISNEPVRVKGEVAALQDTVCSNWSQII